MRETSFYCPSQCVVFLRRCFCRQASGSIRTIRTMTMPRDRRTSRGLKKFRRRRLGISLCCAVAHLSSLSHIWLSLHSPRRNKDPLRGSFGWSGDISRCRNNCSVQVRRRFYPMPLIFVRRSGPFLHTVCKSPVWVYVILRASLLLHRIL